MSWVKGKGDKNDLENNLATVTTKDSPIRLWKVISIFFVFVAGVVIGLASNSHIYRFINIQGTVYGSYTLSPLHAVASKEVVIRNCQNNDCLKMDTFLCPKNLRHNLTDDELFWRASMVPKKEKYPYSRTPKVAFMFLTKGPLVFLPLWEKFFKGHGKLFSIYLHAVPGYELNVSTASPFYQRQIPSKEVQWGEISLVDAERRLLANALLDFSNERFVLLSESCIPVYNLPTVYKYLIRSSHSFVESYDDPSRVGRGRYNNHMKPDIELSDWRKGSQWFEINRDLAVKIVSDTKYYTIFRKLCRPDCYSDEHYIPTLLNMFYGPLNANRTVTWVDWSRGGPHPAMFGKHDILERFIQSIRKSATRCLYNSDKTSVCYLFARKFAPSALEPLLNLSSTVMEF